MRRRKAYRTIYSICLFFIFIQPFSSFAEDGGYKNQLIASAREQRLSENRYWNILLHYKLSVDGRESLIDDPDFFLARDGKRNPETELSATISAFFAPSVSGERHPQCRFPARYAWMKEALRIDDENLPPVSCPNLQGTLKKIHPNSAVLIFAAPYFSGSSTIFGHTLLRIDSDNEDHLLSYAVNYSAHTTDEAGPGFVLKGLAGGFKGYFSMLPYYLKLSEYSDIENRDIWEYYLDLNEEETYRMVLHILELRDIYSDYFFLDENCSFNLLFLIEAGRPSLQLIDHYWSRLGYGVIPLDTVDIVRKAGIVSNVHYRPSPVSQIRYLASQMDKDQQVTAKNVAVQGLPPGLIVSSQESADQKRRTLELSAEYLKYRYSRMELRQEQFQEQFIQIADARKALEVDTKPQKAIPTPKPPESWHRPAKVDFGLGYHENSPFAEITLRPAYRDLLELGSNDSEASQVRLLEISGRYYEKGSQLKLQEATIVNIVSLSARDIFFHPVSWQLLAGFEQNLFPNGDEDIVFQLDAGGGWSFYHPVCGLFYALIQADMKLSSHFKDNIALGPGATVGLVKKITEGWNANLQVQGFFYEVGENYNLYRLGFDQLIEVSSSSAIFLQFGIERADTETRTEVKIGWSYYF